MAELTLHLDEDTARALACAAERDHVSEAAWASEALKARLQAEDRERQERRERLMSLYGSWDDGDDRSIEEIMEELRPRHWKARDVNLD